jgi:HEAT repeat protein
MIVEDSFPTRWSVINRRKALGPDAREAVPAPIGLLEGEESFFRMQAIDALGAIGPDAREAPPHLLPSLRCSNRYLRLRAAEAIRRIESPDSPRI